MQHFAKVVFAVFGLAVPALTAPVDISALQDGDLIPGKYIVSLKPGVDAQAHLSWVQGVHRRSLSRRDTTGLEKTYGFGSFNGYAGEFDEDTVAQIRGHENVMPNHVRFAKTRSR